MSRKIKLLAVILISIAIGATTLMQTVWADDDLLLGEDVVVALPEPQQQEQIKEAEDPHAAVFGADTYPSASQCATCHADIYDEWRTSSHAYASISPMFHKFEQKITDLSQGTIANFCVRCHVSVGTSLGEPREMPIWDRAPVSREGVTCITCHRVSEEYSKVNAERRIEPGKIFDPVYGPTNADALKDVIAKNDYYHVAVDSSSPGMPIHRKTIKFEQIGKSEFCVSCHQVAVEPQIKLEVVWEQYRASPAFQKGITCQDCHMGSVPGVASGYATGPAAVINGEPINPTRRRTNHSFYGPGYPIAHPGIFPHNPKAQSFKVKEWLTFDYRSDWGKPEFEDALDYEVIKVKFPPEWDSPDDRIKARKIVDENIAGLLRKKELRRQVMENGSHVEGPFFSSRPRRASSLRFKYVLQNTNLGHNLPSGSLGAQPEIWVNVALTDPDGKNIWESGYTDSFGDMADIHSEDVQNGRLAFDDQLVNLQTKFLTTNVKGTDREMFLPINLDFDQLPFIRPGAAPNSVLNHPFGIRMEARSIPPTGKRTLSFTVPANLMKAPGSYKLSFRLRSRAEPIYFMRFVGATKDMMREMNEWMLDYHVSAVEFTVR